MGLFFVFIISFLCLLFIDHRLNIVLLHYLDVEVERFTTNIVTKVIHEKVSLESCDDLLQVDSETGIIQYNTAKINQLKNSLTNYAQEALTHLENGEVEFPYISDWLHIGRFPNVKKGIVCDISMGSLRGSTLFANVGPSIPIKLLYMGQVQSKIDFRSKEYGINNIMVEVYIILEIQEQVTMPISSSRKTITIEEPLSVILINGKLPNYYSDFSKTF